MDRLYTASLGLNVPSVGQNMLSDLAVALRVASGTGVATQDSGLEARIFQATSDLAAGTLVQVDENVVEAVDVISDPATVTTAAFDWSDREVFGIFRGFSGASQYPGGANDYQFDDAGAPTLFWGYLGQGAQKSGGGAVSAGNPPVRAAGSSWAAEITANVWLYLDPGDGKLKLYNDTVITIRTPALIFFATGPTGARP